MAHYAVVFVTPKTDTWIPDYLKAVGPLVEKHGGKYLARTTSHERLGVCPSNRKIDVFGSSKTILCSPIVDPGAFYEVDF